MLVGSSHASQLRAGHLCLQTGEVVPDPALPEVRHLDGPELCRARPAPRLEPGASIVVVGSVAGFRASPATPFYGAGKAGRPNLAASLALLLQPQGIRVNVLAPSLIDTPLTDSLDTVLAERRHASIEWIEDDRASAIPMGRAGSVEEISGAAVYLLSAQSSYVTGATLSATGGALASIL